MAKFRKKPVVIDAIQWDGINLAELNDMAGYDFKTNYQVRNDSLVIHTLEGDMHVVIGDWIIKGTKGELYPCKPDIFADIYERIEP